MPETVKEITEARYSELLNCLPPIAAGKKAVELLATSGEETRGWTDAFVSSEPWSHEPDGSGAYLPTFAFCYVKDGKRYL